jgi:hypothetical protein
MSATQDFHAVAGNAVGQLPARNRRLASADFANF